MYSIMAVIPANGATRLLLYSVFFLAAMQNVSGFDCDLVHGGSSSVLDKINFVSAKSCPRIIDSDDKVFCCQSKETLGLVLNYCCDFQTFIQMNWVIYTMVGIAAGILLGCCLCGCCCYRRRTRGAVYGRVQTVVMQQPVAAQGPQTMPHHLTYPAYGTVPAATAAYPVQEVHHMPPPPYGVVTTEVYAKQAPYNPHQY